MLTLRRGFYSYKATSLIKLLQQEAPCLHWMYFLYSKLDQMSGCVFVKNLCSLLQIIILNISLLPRSYIFLYYNITIKHIWLMQTIPLKDFLILEITGELPRASLLTRLDCLTDFVIGGASTISGLSWAYFVCFSLFGERGTNISLRTNI